MKPPATPPLDRGFTEVIQLIATARQRALQAVNTTLIDLYWQVGAIISRKIAAAEWGDGVVTQLAAHIARTQPGLRGFTRPNLFRMRQFYEAYQGDEIVSPLVRQLLSRSASPALIAEYQTQLPDKALLQAKLHEFYLLNVADTEGGS